MKKRKVLVVDDSSTIRKIIQHSLRQANLNVGDILEASNGREALGMVERLTFDLILTGLQSDDQGFGQTGVLLAELLGTPHATIIMQIEVQGQRLKVKRELESGWFQWVELPLPAVLTIQSGINKVRYSSLKGIMAAKKKEIAMVARESLGVVHEPTQHVERIYVPEKAKHTEFIDGSPKEAAAKLIEKLRHEARVL